MEIYNDTYCVYVHINKINGKMYVGYTVHGDDPNAGRWKDGKGYLNKNKKQKYTQPYFAGAITTHGWENFEHEVIASNLTKEEAMNFERLLIEKLNTTNPEFGYNLTSGGEECVGLCLTETSLQKRKQSMKKYYTDEKYIQKMKDSHDKKAVWQFTTEGKLVASYESTMEASRRTGVHSAAISNCALRQKLSAKGYIWVYENDLSNIEERVLLYANKGRKKSA